ncbi:MAG: hypothetical protein EHM12_13090 [Dehalococcoidia bacterium]|nr:MAG: hypothetical protein EHM12_13090 [Dehalococcoidia bacterium]
MLSRRQPHLAVVGRSDWNGFTLYGPLDTVAVDQATREALHRLRRGEANLAVHPRCGTVLATTGLLTGLAAFLALSLDTSGGRSRFRWAAIPSAVLAATVAAIVAQPLGLLFQERYTVSGNPGRLEIKTISSRSTGNLTIHRIETGE